MDWSRSESMSIRLTTLPSRPGVRQRSRMRRNEKAALPAPMMLIFAPTVIALHVDVRDDPGVEFLVGPDRVLLDRADDESLPDEAL